MKICICTVLFASILGSLVAPASAFEVLGKVTLEPMDLPSPRPLAVGDELHWLKDGKSHILTIDSRDEENNTSTFTNSDGCSWTTLTYQFAPSFSWNNCAGSSGTQKITKTKGTPWPLSVKTNFRYSFRGKRSDGGKPWTSTRKCKVTAQERVKVPAGEFDTYKVVCSEKWNTRIWWVSPELGHGVAFQRKHKTDSSRSYMNELVKIVNP